MAAGNSRRFGSNKLLHVYDGKPLYRHGLDMLISFCSHRTDCSLIVVSQYQEILRQAELCGISSVYSVDSKQGMSYTIKAALHALGNIPEEDFKDAVQIIGWMYQYYNTEPKDQVFADLKKNIKIFKTVRSNCSGSVDGLIVNPNNAEPKYFTSYKEAESYAKSTKEQYDLLPCKEIVI